MTQKDNNDDLTEEELERKLDTLWKNWQSRRQGEKKHIPNYIKNNKEK